MPNQKQYSKQDCIDSLQQAAEIIDGSISIKDYHSTDLKPSARRIRTIFDSWNAAKKSAGLKQNVTSNVQKQDPPKLLNYDKEEWKELSKYQRCEKRKRVYWAKEKLKRGCKECGFDDHPCSLEWHHTNPDKKEMCVSRMINLTLCREKIENEVKKCEVLCANCHKKKTYGETWEI